MTTEERDLPSETMIEKIFSSYNVSLSIFKEKIDNTDIYVVMIIWSSDIAHHVTGGGKTLFEALLSAYTKIKHLELKNKKK